MWNIISEQKEKALISFSKYLKLVMKCINSRLQQNPEPRHYKSFMSTQPHFRE
jgi:hypothetical protein